MRNLAHHAAPSKVILPATRISEIRDDIPTYRLPLEVGGFIGEWDVDRIIWRMSETITVDAKLSSRGICEPAIIQLRDGRYLMIGRGSNAGIPSRSRKSTRSALRSSEIPSGWLTTGR